MDNYQVWIMNKFDDFPFSSQKPANLTILSQTISGSTMSRKCIKRQYSEKISVRHNTVNDIQKG